MFAFVGYSLWAFTALGVISLLPGCISKDATLQSAVERSPNSTALAGADLYQMHCASCHGRLAVSSKKDRTAEQITTALDLSEMVSLKGKLSAEDIRAIALVLQSGADYLPPTIPQNLGGRALGPSGAALSWAPSQDNEGGSGLVGYHIYRDNGLVHTVPVGVHSYSDAGLSPDTAYSYQVAAVDRSENASERSVRFTITTGAAQSGDDTTAPSVPTLSGSVLSASRVRLTWTDSTDEVGGSGLKHYQVFTVSGGVETHLIDVGPGEQPKEITHLPPGSTTGFKVRAVDNDGNASAKSNLVTLSTPLADGPSLYAARCGHCHGQTAATSTKRNRSETAIKNAILGYPEMTNDPIGNLLELSDGEIRAIALALSDVSDTSPPTSPGNFQVVPAGPRQVVLSWTPSTESGGSGFQFYKITRGTTVVSTVTNISATQLTDAGLSPETTYTYKIEAFDNANNKSAAATDSVTTPRETITDTTPPSTPVLSLTTLSATRIRASWMASTDAGGIQGYRLERVGRTAVLPLAGDRNFEDINLSANTTYAYRIIAIDNSGNESTPSSVVSAQTPLANGSALYSANCAGCHTTSGSSGNGPEFSTKRNSTAAEIAAAILAEPAMRDTNPNVESNLEKLGTDDIAAIARVLSDAADTVPPTVPGNFQATATGPRQVSLSWNASTETGGSGFKHYEIFRNNVLISTITNRTTTTFSDGGRTPSTAYNYKIEALDNANNKSAAATDSVTTPPETTGDTTPPSAPTLTLTVESATRIRVNWTAATDAGGIQEYRIVRVGRDPVTRPASDRSWTDTNLAANRSYTYKIIAIDNSDNESAPGTGVSAQTSVANGSALYVTNCATCHTATGSSGNGPEFSTKRNSTAAEIAAAILAEPAMRDTNPNVESNLEKLGDADIAAIARALSDAADTVAPTVPGNFQATATGPRQVSLSWNASTETGGSGFKHYEISRNNVPISTVTNRTTTTFTDGGRTPETAYTYKIEAIDNANNESAAATDSVTTPAETTGDTTPPSAPTVTLAVQSATRIRINWTAATDAGGIQNYRIVRVGRDPVTRPASDRSWTDTNLAANRSYTYKVIAVDNSDNESAPGTGVSAQTPLADGTALYVTNCAGCHTASGSSDNGPASSTKRNSTATEIAAAILAEPAMRDTNPNVESNLEKLGADDIAAIARVLSDAADTVAPSAPPSFAAIAENYATVKLTWGASTDNLSGVSNYKIYRKSQTAVLFTVAAGDPRLVRDSGRTASTLYEYEIRAFDAAGNVSAVSAAAVTTPARPVVPDTTPPGNPPNLVASALSSTRVRLTWNTADDNTDGSGVKRYHVYRNGFYLGPTTAETYTDSQRAENTAYQFTVRTEDNAGNLSTGASVSITTPTADGLALYNAKCLNCHSSHGPPATAVIKNASAAFIKDRILNELAMKNNTSRGLQLLGADEIAAIARTLADAAHQDATNPTAPTNLAGVATSSQINLVWDASADSGSGVKYYKVYSGNVEAALIAHPGRFVAFSGLRPATAHTFKVKAFDNFGNASAFSASLTLSTLPASSTPDTTAPSRPTGVTAMAAIYSVRLTWNEATDNTAVNKYNIYRSGVRVGTVYAPLRAFTNGLLTPSTTYSYTVTATDFAGNESFPSAAVNATTQAPVGEQLYVSRNCYSCHGLPPDQYITGQGTLAGFRSAYLAIIHPQNGRGAMQGMPRISDGDLDAIANWALTLGTGGGADNPAEASTHEYRLPVGTRTYLGAKLIRVFVGPPSTTAENDSLTDLITRDVTGNYTSLGGPISQYDNPAINPLAGPAAIAPSQSAGRTGVLLNACAQVLERAPAIHNALARANVDISAAIDQAALNRVYGLFFPGVTLPTVVLTSLEALATQSSSAGLTRLDAWRMILLSLCESSLTEGL